LKLRNGLKKLDEAKIMVE
jgi:hypothetical protein